MTLPVQVPSDTDPQQLEMAAVLRGYRTESGRSLLALLDESPLLLITLRHFGYSFCRQTLDEVSVIEQIEAQSIRSVFVHLRSPERAKPYFDYYHLSDIERVSDPDASSVAAQKTFFSWYLVSRRLEGLATRCGSQTGMIKEDADQTPQPFLICASGPSSATIAIGQSQVSQII